MAGPLRSVLPLDSGDASLEEVGGKGAALAVLARAGLPVPEGFLVTTHAYRAFVRRHALQGAIDAALGDAQGGEAGARERASARIRALFSRAPLGDELTEAILEAGRARWDETTPVAVRSSATAEDLPDASFAGQHDTHLGVRGGEAMLAAVRSCWASLWTPRAIAYRIRHGTAPDCAAMGVVVQRLVDADVSGILFTANPTTGARDELVVNASYGLGEAVVGGEVGPDAFVLDRSTRAVKHRELGEKAKRVVASRGQGTVAQPVDDARRRTACLTDPQLAELAGLALDAERVLGGRPQDVEWAIADGIPWLLQSRPITRLPPPPLRDVRWQPPAEGMKLIRRQIVENMPDPLSPLFEALYLTEALDGAMDGWLRGFGAPAKLDDLIQRPFFVTVHGFAYCRADYPLTWRLLRSAPRVLAWYARIVPRLIRDVIPRWREQGVAAYLAQIDVWRARDREAASDAELLEGLRALARADADYWFHVAMVLGIAKTTDALLNAFLSSRLVPGRRASAVFLRGFPSRTLDAQADLEAIAARIRGDAALRRRVLAAPAARLREALAGSREGESVRGAIERHLATCGHTIYTLDFAEPTQGEEPLPVLSTLRALVADGERESIVRRQAALRREREEQEREVGAAVGPVRRWAFRTLLGWAQRYGAHREDALFFVGAAWPTLRARALELGRRLVDAGSLAAPDDVFFLDASALEAACAARAAGCARPEAAREAARNRELREARRRLHPPAMIPEHARFRLGPISMEGWETQKRTQPHAGWLEGFAVSPGRVAGRASVILSPADFADMQPQTILVCPTTTPAWTPLFAQATGLVTDVGGILAHGSIVAREYGIPAVMGTGTATQRIHSGQPLTVDGDTGTVHFGDGPTS